jgi:pimeloyl-ACP methyl ester carboxylesterase
LDNHSEDWNGAMHFLSKKPDTPGAPDLSDYSMIAPSLRGQGKTAEAELQKYGAFPREIKMNDQVKIVETVTNTLKQLGMPLDQIHLIGHSYGGEASLEVAAKSALGMQGSNSKLVSVDLMASFVDHFPNYKPGAMYDPMLNMSSFMEAVNPIGYDYMNQQIWLPMMMQNTKEMGALSKTSDWTDPRRVDGIAAMTAGVIKSNTFKTVQEATARHPDLVINVSAAGKDGLVPIEAEKALFDHIPPQNRGSELFINADHGHRMTEEDPQGVAAWIANVVKQAEQRTRASSLKH